MPGAKGAVVASTRSNFCCSKLAALSTRGWVEPCIGADSGPAGGGWTEGEHTGDDDVQRWSWVAGGFATGPEMDQGDKFLDALMLLALRTMAESST